MHVFGRIVAVVLAFLVLAPAPGRAELRISDLDVFLTGRDLTVHVALLDALPPGIDEAVRSGIPAHVRLTVEVWQYNRLWRDRLVSTKVVERTVEYNVVTREYRVAAVRGEPGPTYTTRDVSDARRALSEVRSLKLVPTANLPTAEVFYVRVLAESALRGDNTLVTRLAGTAEQTLRQSDLRTLPRLD
jgi:hypothetical protein